MGNNFISAKTLDVLCSALEISPKVLFDFENNEMTEEISLDEIVKRLKNNPYLLKITYKIVMALDY